MDEFVGLKYRHEDYSDLFLISRNGEIKNKKTNRILKHSLNKRGYLQVNVSLGSRQNKKLIKIHIAVASTFLGYCDNLVVNHIDGDKTNNRVDNLEWVTRSGNTQHAYDNLLCSTSTMVMCNETGVVFNSFREAGRWVGLDKCAGSLKEYFNPKFHRISCGRHPITGQRLTWSIVNK